VRCNYSPRKKMGRPKKRLREESSTTLGPDSTSNSLDISSNIEAFDMPNISAASSARKHYQDISMIPPIPWSLNTASECVPAMVDTTFAAMDATPATMNSLSNLSTLPYMEPTTCSCITITSLAMQTMQTMTTFHFPSSLGGLRNIMSSLSTVIHCPICPTQQATTLQNNLLLQTTLACLAERFQGLLFGLEQEYQRLIMENKRPQIRIGDPTIPLAYHIGSPDCPQGFNVSLEPEQWKQMARKELMTLLKGPENSLAQLIRDILERQVKWHADPNSNVVHMKQSSSTTSNGGKDPNNCIVNLGEILNQIDKIT